MPTARLLASALALALLTATALAQSPLKPVTFTDTRLSNGLRVIISEDRAAPVVRWPNNRGRVPPVAPREVRAWGVCLFLAGVAVSMLEESGISFLAVTFMSYQWLQLTRVHRNLIRLSGRDLGQARGRGASGSADA
jgi:hypothetical protein